jgi:hypothetical protein
MMHAVQIGSGAITYTPGFIKTASGIQKFIRRGIHRHTDRKEIA